MMNATLLANRPVLTQAHGKMPRDNGQIGTVTVRDTGRNTNCTKKKRKGS